MADEQVQGSYWRDRADQATRRRDHWKGIATTALTERDDARKELDTLRAKLKEVEGAPDRARQLEGELKTLRTRHTFDRLARERGASDEVLDDLFQLSGFKGELDEKAAAKWLDEAKEHPARSRHFAKADEAEEKGDEPEEKPAKKPSPETGRGKRADGKGTVTITRAMLADPAWALDPRNAEIKRTAKVVD